MRNPKDNVVSFYHFSKALAALETPESFDQFFEPVQHPLPDLRGNDFGKMFLHIFCCSFSVVFLLFFQDLKGSVKKICNFLGINLTEAAISQVVEKAKFENMKKDSKANYEHIPPEKFSGKFLRKGQIGDWKNTMTVAQSERVDQVLQEKLGDLPLRFIWE
uniref:Sulfotransferase n=1 Tax=Haplochromis burtoni TaxID=8153 RepID=A0A3Q3CWJ6_HAPBU